VDKPKRRGWISPAESSRIRVLAKSGYSTTYIGEVVGRSSGGVAAALRARDDPRDRVYSWRTKYCASRLSMVDREEIRAGLARGQTYTAIAKRIGRAVSTVSREVDRGGGRLAYRAVRAHQDAYVASRRPRAGVLEANQALAGFVIEHLGLLWSPEKISRALQEAFPDDPMMRVSHESIYKSLYVQGRGELRRELARCLRSGRAHRRPQGRLQARGKLSGMVMISERPPEVADRAVPGHWEGDLIMGPGNASAVGTLVERSTRYLMLLALPGGHGAESVRLAMTKAISGLPAELVKTITWDQGKEMAQHATFSVETGVAVYFCDPHSPWQRGSNENTNGLLRDFMPKGKDLSALSQENLDWFAYFLNTRPRETLGFKTPSEKLAEVLALTG